jgi:hypothetical protein
LTLFYDNDRFVKKLPIVILSTSDRDIFYGPN